MPDTTLLSSNIAALLKPYEQITYQDTLLYLVDAPCMQQLFLMQQRFEEEGGMFSSICKLINPLFPAFKYSLGTKHKYRAVYDQEKIRERFEKEIEISYNTAIKRAREEIENHPDVFVDEELAAKFLKESQKKAEEDKAALQKIANDIDSYDIVFTNFERRLFYPYVYYRYEDSSGKRRGKSEHLKKEIPNVLWYAPSPKEDSLRLNDRIRRIVSEYPRYLDTIYAKKKKETE